MILQSLLNLLQQSLFRRRRTCTTDVCRSSAATVMTRLAVRLAVRLRLVLVVFHFDYFQTTTLTLIQLMFTGDPQTMGTHPIGRQQRQTVRMDAGRTIMKAGLGRRPYRRQGLGDSTGPIPSLLQWTLIVINGKRRRIVFVVVVVAMMRRMRMMMMIQLTVFIEQVIRSQSSSSQVVHCHCHCHCRSRSSTTSTASTTTTSCTTPTFIRSLATFLHQFTRDTQPLFRRPTILQKEC